MPRYNTDENGLTPKEAAFVREYLVCLEAKHAAEKAGYSMHTAKVRGYALLQLPRIAAAVAKGKAERAERTQIDADWLLTHLTLKAKADLADIYTTDGALKPVHEWPLIWRQGLIAGVETDELRADGAVMGTVRKVKIADRTKLDELIGKHVDVQAFKERHEHTGPNGAALVPVLNVTIGRAEPESSS